MTIHLHRDVSQPGDSSNPAVLVLSLHAEEGQPGHLPTGPSQQVGAGALEVIEEAVEGVVMGVPKDHTSAGASGLAIKGPFLLLAVLKLPTGRL